MEKHLPKNWIESTLDELATVQSGGTPSRGISSYWNGSIPWVKISDIKEMYVDKTTEFITDEGLKNSSTRIFPKGTILFTIFATLGKIGILNIDAATNQAIAGITPSKAIIDKYLTYSLIDLSNSISENGKGVAQKNINQAILKDTKIPLPPLAEQRRLVDKLDRLFAHLQEIRTRIEYLNDTADRFTYSCLVDSKKNRFHQREKIGQFLEEGSGRIGQNWHGLRLIGVSSKEGITDLRIGQKESFEKYKIVKPGDFIYNTMRVNIGSIAIYKGSVNALTSPDYVVFRVSKHLSSQLLLNFLKSDSGLLEIGANTKGSVRARLYFKALSEVRMPIAPVEIQNLAENFLKGFKNNLMTLNELKKTKLERLSQSILHKAFKGELSEQLDSDGDARDLLKEIEVLKSSIKKSKTK